MNELEIINSKNIKSMIYEMRDKKVMLDSDLAKLYQVETKRINEAVKNNINKFPERFSWKLTDVESHNFLVENFDQKIETRGGKYKNPRVFTEQGVAMLATILKSPIATEVSIAIMDAFVAMRHYISDNSLVFKNQIIMNSKLENQEQHLLILDNKINELFSKFEFKEQTEKIFFNGDIYDAYSKLIDIMNEAKEELIIIDNYADKTVLDMISKLKVNVTLIVKTKSLLTQTDIKKYNDQYHNLKIVYNNSFHDRYLILDKKEIYHCGASLNYAGSKIFSINKLEDKDIKSMLINKVNNLR